MFCQPDSYILINNFHWTEQDIDRSMTSYYKSDDYGGKKPFGSVATGPTWCNGKRILPAQSSAVYGNSTTTSQTEAITGSLTTGSEPAHLHQPPLGFLQTPVNTGFDYSHRGTDTGNILADPQIPFWTSFDTQCQGTSLPANGSSEVESGNTFSIPSDQTTCPLQMSSNEMTDNFPP